MTLEEGKGAAFCGSFSSEKTAKLILNSMHALKAKFRTKSGEIWVYEDCAGLGTMLDAIRRTGLAVRGIGASEEVVWLQTWLRRCGYGIVDSDLRKKTSLVQMTRGSLTIYAIGYLCQPYSSNGLKKGDSDPRVRGMMSKVIAFIDAHEPRVVFLEEVFGFDQTRAAKILKCALRRAGYTVSDFMFDSRAYVPQHRDRYYIVAVHTKWSDLTPDRLTEVLTPTPEDAPPMLEDMPPHGMEFRPMCEFTSKSNSDGEATVIARNAGYVQTCGFRHLSVADFGASPTRQTVQEHISPCVTKARAESRRLYLVTPGATQAARLTLIQLGFLQGWSQDDVTAMLEVADQKDCKVGAALGNGMTVPVVQAIIANLHKHCPKCFQT